MIITKFSAVLFLVIFIHICNGEDECPYIKDAIFKKIQVPSADVMIVNSTVTETPKLKLNIFVSFEYGTRTPYLKAKTNGYGVEIPNLQKVNLCNNKSTEKFNDGLTRFSYMANKCSMNVVDKILNIQPCLEDLQTCAASCKNCEGTKNCLSDNFLFNTDVFFVKKENLIAQYHKNNFYFEFLDTPQKSEMTTFKPEFEVFGTTVYLDSVYRDAIHLEKNYNVETLMFKTNLFNDVFINNAIEWQQPWANGINYLTINKYLPANSIFGRRIYSKDYGALKYTYNPLSKLSTCDVPRHEMTHNFFNNKTIIVEKTKATLKKEKTNQNFPLYYYCGKMGIPIRKHHCYNLQNMRHKSTNSKKLRREIKSWDKNKVNLTKENYIAIFSGQNNVFNNSKLNGQTCSLAGCDSFESNECALVPSQVNTSFTFVEMKDKFNNKDVYPTVSAYWHPLFSKRYWTFDTEKENQIPRFKSEKAEFKLKVGTFSRNYSKSTIYSSLQ